MCMGLHHTSGVNADLKISLLALRTQHNSGNGGRPYKNWGLDLSNSVPLPSTTKP